MRDLYADGRFDSDVFDAVLSDLNENLREYTGEDDVSLLSSLILDLADGVQYTGERQGDLPIITE